MVYTALQFITRGREHGISTVDLGKKTGYDQKTCFYLIKQLLELELVVKLRRGGVGTNFCIHKYFFERSPLWRQIQDEGVNSSKDYQEADGGGFDNEEVASTQDGFQASVQFDPIDARHLSSLSLIQSRIVKLLKHSESHTHPSQNLLVTIVSEIHWILNSHNVSHPFSGLLEPYQNRSPVFPKSAPRAY
jgi:transcription factor C subunit 3